MNLVERPAAAPIAAPAGLRLVPLRAGRWRVTRTDGSVLGYLDRTNDADGSVRFQSMRMVGGVVPRMMPLGEFWRIEDAIDALR